MVPSRCPNRPVVLGALAVLGVLGSLASPAVAGSCRGSHKIHALAIASPMPRDGRVLLEVAGEDLDVTHALTHARFLTAEGDVPARIVMTLEGGRLQALLAPARPLPAGGVVHLALGIPALDEKLAAQPLAVSDVASAPAPRWRRAPRAGRWLDEASNKGDGTHAMKIRVDLRDGPAWVLATIATPRRTVRAIIPATRGSIAIGNVGCYSMYTIEERGRARVTLTAIGASGQEVAAPGSPITIRF